MKRRRLAPEERREEIYQAAVRLLIGRGPEIRVEDVVAEAGAAKGTFYTCFPTWDDLLEEIRARKSADLLRDMASALTPKTDEEWRMALPTIAGKFVAFVEGMGGLHEALFHSDFAQARPLPRQARPSARLAALLRNGQEAGHYAAFAPEPVARLLFSLIHETADAIVEGADRRDAIETLNWMIGRITLR